MAGKSRANRQAPTEPTTLTSLAEIRPSGNFELARRELTRREQSLMARYEEQRMAEGLYAAKARYGQQLMNELHLSAVGAFETMATSIWTVMEGTHPPGLQNYIDRFCHRSIEVGGAYIHEAANKGSDNILNVIDERLSIQTQRRTFMQRLLSREDEY